MQKKIGGAKTTLLKTPLNATNHAFWRIRHEAATGRVIFEAAPNSGGAPGAWVQLNGGQRYFPGQVPNEPAPFFKDG